MSAGEVTPELVMELLRPNEVALSPDGSRIAFAVSASFREQGKPIETRLWVGDVGGELRPGEAGALPRFSPDGSRLAFASDRGHEGRLSLRVDDRELGEIPGSVEDIHWSPDGTHLLVLAADLGADRAGAQSATKIQEAGAEQQDPKVFRPALFWRRLWLVDAATGDTRDVTPERRQRLRGRLGRREGRRGLHGRAVGERLVRRVGRPDRPRRARGRARPHAEVAAAVRRGSRRAGRSRSSRASRPTAARLPAPSMSSAAGRLRRSCTRRGSSSPTRTPSGSRATAAPARSPAGSRSTAPTRSSRAASARSGLDTRLDSRSARTARAPPRPARAPTRRPRSCSGRTASGGR